MASSDWGASFFLFATRHSPLAVDYSAMQLDLLTALNTERAARRAAIVVTDIATGHQRLVKAADVARIR